MKCSRLPYRERGPRKRAKVTGESQVSVLDGGEPAPEQCHLIMEGAVLEGVSVLPWEACMQRLGEDLHSLIWQLWSNHCSLALMEHQGCSVGETEPVTDRMLCPEQWRHLQGLWWPELRGHYRVSGRTLKF